MVEAAFNDLYEAWQTRGMEAIQAMIDTKPADFVRIIASLLPRELKITAPMSDLSDGELYDLIEQLKRVADRETQLARENAEARIEQATEHKQIICAVSK
jgi:hypothetical protein